MMTRYRKKLKSLWWNLLFLDNSPPIFLQVQSSLFRPHLSSSNYEAISTRGHIRQRRRIRCLEPSFLLLNVLFLLDLD